MHCIACGIIVYCVLLRPTALLSNVTLTWLQTLVSRDGQMRGFLNVFKLIISLQSNVSGIAIITVAVHHTAYREFDKYIKLFN